MSVKQMEIPVAEMEVEAVETKYAIAPDGTIGEVTAIKENLPELQEQMQ